MGVIESLEKNYSYILWWANLKLAIPVMPSLTHKIHTVIVTDIIDYFGLLDNVDLPISDDYIEAPIDEDLKLSSFFRPKYFSVFYLLDFLISIY